MEFKETITFCLWVIYLHVILLTVTGNVLFWRFLPEASSLNVLFLLSRNNDSYQPGTFAELISSENFNHREFSPQNFRTLNESFSVKQLPPELLRYGRRRTNVRGSNFGGSCRTVALNLSSKSR